MTYNTMKTIACIYVRTGGGLIDEVLELIMSAVSPLVFFYTSMIDIMDIYMISFVYALR